MRNLQKDTINSGSTDVSVEPVEIIVDKLDNWLEVAVAILPNLFFATVILVTGYFLSKIAVQIFSRTISKRIAQESIRSLLKQIVKFVVLAATIFLALAVMDLDKVITSALAGAGIVGLAVALALQGAMSNSYSGIMMALRESIQVGNFIDTNGYSGTVKEIGLRATKLLEPDNNLVIIPNKDIYEKSFKNYSLTNRSKVILSCGVGYESDLDHVQQIVLNTIAQNVDHLDRSDIDFFYEEFGSSSINFTVRYWMDADDSLQVLRAKSSMIKSIKKAFDTEGINIPFPIRTLKWDPSDLTRSINLGTHQSQVPH